MFVCLDFGHFIVFIFLFPFSAKLIGSAKGVSIL